MGADSSFGRMQIDCPQPLIAGHLVTVIFDFTVGNGGMRKGARLRIGLPNVGWARPEAEIGDG